MDTSKTGPRSTGDAWEGVWSSFCAQTLDPGFSTGDRLVLALGTRSDLSGKLQDLAERAAASTDETDWRKRIGVGLSKPLKAIESAITAGTRAFALLRTVEVRVLTSDEMDSEFLRLDLGTVSPAPIALQSYLRDLAGGAARVRGTFRAAPLRRILSAGFGADLFEPRDWGLAAYRNTVGRYWRIQIPGKHGLSAPASDLIVWPRARLLETGPDLDFEDETPSWRIEETKGDVNLEQFPDDGMRQGILVAGPGFGKSTLVSAIGARLLSTPMIPVQIALGDFAQADRGVLEFMETNLNQAFSIQVVWRHLADRGLLCVLFDGLDEVPTADKEKVITRTRLFASRFPDVAWLLTVRDPAALNGPLDAPLIELLPFDNPEISRLVDKFKVWSPGLDAWTFISGLQAYPDVAKLARIPLFLSMILGSWEPDAPLPTKRSDLIETYLGDLFRNRKQWRQGTVGPKDGVLRKVAQAMAFDSLEREEIGLSERQATKVVARHTEHNSDVVLTRLLATGVLRRSPTGRLHFPYPVVQEYLAAVHIVDVLPDQVAPRIADVVKRPWAQVIQFALELLPDATSYVESMLRRPDDAFSTGLRLIGRCIANGAHVEPSLRHEIGTRLALLWERCGYSVRERVGRLIVDAYSRPLHPEVDARLGRRWLLGSGASEIISARADPDLTIRVVRELLDRWLDTFMGLRELKPVLQAVAVEVVVLAASRARRPGTTVSELHGVTEFFEAVRLQGPPPPELAELIADESKPLFLRLSARCALSEAPDKDAVRSAIRALESSGWEDRSSALELLARIEDKAGTAAGILVDPGLGEAAKSHLLERFDRFVGDRRRRAEVAGEVLPHAREERHRDILRIYQLRAGDRQAFATMIERIEHATPDVVQEVLVSMNLFPERGPGELALEKVRLRVDEPANVPSLVAAALNGLTRRIGDDGWEFYSLEDAALPFGPRS